MNHKILQRLCRLREKIIFSLFPAIRPYSVFGTGNTLIVYEATGTKKIFDLCKDRFPGLEIKIYGNKNTIILHKPLVIDGTHINIGVPYRPNDSSIVEIESTYNFTSNTIHITHGNKQQLFIGKNTTMYSCSIALPESSKCAIGEDCMFASHVTIRAADGHCVYDTQTGEILNHSTAEVKIGNHCWIGSKAVLLKKAQLADNCIVAKGSIVTKPFLEKGSILAGNPAQVKRTGVSWARESPADYIATNTPLPLEQKASK